MTKDEKELHTQIFDTQASPASCRGCEYLVESRKGMFTCLLQETEGGELDECLIHVKKLGGA